MLLPAIVITPPEMAAITIEEVKLELRLEDGDGGLDALIEMHLDTAIEHVEQLTGTRLAAQIIELRGSSFCDFECLTYPPVNAVISVKYLDAVGVEQVLADGSSELFGGGLEWGLRPAFETYWPSVRQVRDAIRVRLNVGYSDDGVPMPKALRTATLMKLRGLMDGDDVDGAVERLTINHRG